MMRSKVNAEAVRTLIFTTTDTRQEESTTLCSNTKVPGFCSVEFCGTFSGLQIWRKNEAYDEENILPTAKHGGGSVMIWCCFPSSGAGELQGVEG